MFRLKFWGRLCLLFPLALVLSLDDNNKDYPIEHCSFPVNNNKEDNDKNNVLRLDTYSNNSVKETFYFSEIDFIRKDICMDMPPFPVNDYLEFVEDCHNLNFPQLHLGIGIGSHLFQSDFIEGSIENALQYLHDYMKPINVIVQNQFNINFKIKHVIISIDETSKWDNKNCRNSIYRQFAFWRDFTDNMKKQPENVNLFWHLLDACFSWSSPIGVATVGTAGCNGNAPSITQISRRNDNNRGYITSLHELGHSLGGLHQFMPGIMGGFGISKRFQEKLQMNKESAEEICRGLNRVFKCNPSKGALLYHDLIENNEVKQEKCGNGIVENFEECDSRTVCCMPNCKLSEFAECDYNSNQCCNRDCTLKPYTSECELIGYTGYCRNGYCTTIDLPCNNPEYIECGINCTGNRPLPTIFYVQNDTICTKNSQRGRCRDATCKVQKSLQYYDFSDDCFLKKHCDFTIKVPKRNNRYLSKIESKEVSLNCFESIHEIAKEPIELQLIAVRKLIVYSPSSIKVIYKGPNIKQSSIEGNKGILFEEIRQTSNKYLPGNNMATLSEKNLQNAVFLSAPLKDFKIQNQDSKRSIFLSVKVFH